MGHWCSRGNAIYKIWHKSKLWWQTILGIQINDLIFWASLARIREKYGANPTCPGCNLSLFWQASLQYSLQIGSALERTHKCMKYLPTDPGFLNLTQRICVITKVLLSLWFQPFTYMFGKVNAFPFHYNMRKSGKDSSEKNELLWRHKRNCFHKAKSAISWLPIN